MTMTAETATVTLKLNHDYAFPRDKVYEALSDAEALGKWFGPHSHKCQVEKFDFREGGEYQIRMIPITEETECGNDSSCDSVCAGSFVRIVQNSEIVMTFDWIENGADLGDSLLSFKLSDLANGGTRIDITHEKLPDKQIADMHQMGWQGSLECLQQYLEGN